MTTAPTSVDIGSLIYSRPDLHSGRACIAGTGMTVQRVAVLFNQGMTAEEIQAEYPHIDLTRFYAAIAHYLANKAAIDQDIAEDIAMYERLSKEFPGKLPRSKSM